MGNDSFVALANRRQPFAAPSCDTWSRLPRNILFDVIGFADTVPGTVNATLNLVVRPAAHAIGSSFELPEHNGFSGLFSRDVCDLQAARSGQFALDISLAALGIGSIAVKAAPVVKRGIVGAMNAVRSQTAARSASLPAGAKMSSTIAHMLTPHEAELARLRQLIHSGDTAGIAVAKAGLQKRLASGRLEDAYSVAATLVELQRTEGAAAQVLSLDLPWIYQTALKATHGDSFVSLGQQYAYADMALAAVESNMLRFEATDPQQLRNLLEGIREWTQHRYAKAGEAISPNAKELGERVFLSRTNNRVVPFDAPPAAPGLARVEPTTFASGSVELADYRATASDQAGARWLMQMDERVAVQTPGLTAEEEMAIRRYTGKSATEAGRTIADQLDYYSINRTLRDRDIVALQPVEPYIKTLASGLAKGPRFVGTAYRTISLTGEQASVYADGAIVTERAFTSATIDPIISTRSGNTVFVIAAKHKARSIAAFAQIPGEAEVVFPPGTRFRVLGRDVSEYQREARGERRVIYLEEAE